MLFGPFRLDNTRSALTRDGDTVPLGQHSYALIKALVEAGGATVSRQALIERAWPGVVVEDGNLTVQIAALRKALEPCVDGEWVVTVPRRGYRLGVSASDPNDATGTPQGVRPALAVLPFSNISGDPAQEYFADGVVEDIITALSRFRLFTVVARNSSFVYKGRTVDVRKIGQELDVRYVLEGSVRRVGNKLRVAAQLIDAPSGTHLWAHNFDGSVDNVFDAQDQITEGVAAVVEPTIRRAEIERSRRKRPERFDAYDLYLQAIAKLATRRQDENAKAYGILLESLALDPDYAPALAKAAWALEVRFGLGWPALTKDDRASCLTHCAAALAHANGDAGVLANCAMSLMIGREYEQALQVIANATAANPNHAPAQINAGIVKLHCGNLEESLVHSWRGVEMTGHDPSNRAAALTAVAHAQIAAGRFELALEAAERSLAVNRNFDCTYWMLTAANVHLGRLAEGRRWLKALRALSPTVTVATIRAGQPARFADRIEPILEGLRLAGLPER